MDMLMPKSKKTNVDCQLTPLEAAALSFALGIINDLVVGTEQLTEGVTVLDRWNTKVGSFVDFDRSEVLKTKAHHKREICDSISGNLDVGSIEFGVLVFVNDSYISGLEFFSYRDAVGADWSGQNQDFDLCIYKEELS